MILYTYHRGHFDCNGRGVLHSYLVGLLVVLALIILSLLAIVYVSARGKSNQISINILLKIRCKQYIVCD